jgi:uncharacterized membrane protein
VIDEYIATLMTFIAVPVFAAIFFISLIAEKIEKSKVSKEYFVLMLGLAVIPAIIFYLIFKSNGGTSFDWSKK